MVKNTTKRAEMQCSDVNPGTIQKAEPHPVARGAKHVNLFHCVSWRLNCISL